VALGCLHRSLALEEWEALKSGTQKDESFERSVGAFDLFILDEAPEGDLDDVSLKVVVCLHVTFHPWNHVDVLLERS
jgi:hypothetical protein